MSDSDKPAGQITLLLYRIAIGPILLALASWVWDLQKDVNRLTQENTALFATAARLEQWARDSRRQAAYLEGLKDTILSNASGAREFRISVEMPQKELEEQLAALESQREEDLSFFQEALASLGNMVQADPPPASPDDGEVTAEVPDEAVRRFEQQVQQQQQQLIPDYDQMPEMSPGELERYRATKTRGAK